MGKNSKKHEKFSKKPSFLVFADFHAEGGFGETFCIKGELKFRTQWLIWAIFKKILRQTFGWFSGKKRAFFSDFLENPPNGRKYGKKYKMKMKRLAKPQNCSFHKLRQKINFTPSKWQKTRLSKNGPFLLADFYYFLWGAFAQIFTEPSLGPQKKLFFFVWPYLTWFKSYSCFRGF